MNINLLEKNVQLFPRRQKEYRKNAEIFDYRPLMYWIFVLEFHLRFFLSVILQKLIASSRVTWLKDLYTYKNAFNVIKVGILNLKFSLIKKVPYISHPKLLFIQNFCMVSIWIAGGRRAIF